MIAAFLAKIGLPALIAAIEGALLRLDHPAAETASQALGAVKDALAQGTVSPEAIAEANRHIEAMASLETAEARAALAEINATIRAETQAGDAYTRRWRPTLGYIVAIAWGAQMLGASYVIVAYPETAAAVLGALAQLFPMWSVALGVLGVAVIKRSDDKRLAAGHAPAPGLGDWLAGALGRNAGATQNPTPTPTPTR